jgi:hypothetical protein
MWYRETLALEDDDAMPGVGEQRRGDRPGGPAATTTTSARPSGPIACSVAVIARPRHLAVEATVKVSQRFCQ